MSCLTVAAKTAMCVLMAGMAMSSAPLAQSSPAPSTSVSGTQLPLVSGALTGIGDGMSEEQIRGFLKAKGYTDLGRFDRQGDSFTIDHGKRYGRAVDDIQVDAGTGQVANLRPLNEQQVKVLLERQGYELASVSKKDGRDFDVQASRDGRLHYLRVDALTEALQTRCD